MKILNIILLMLAILLTINLVVAQQPSLGVFKQDTCINLKQICSTCTWVNITSILYPNGSQDNTTHIMTKVGTDFTYYWCNSSQLGDYIVNGNSDVNIWNFDFKITSTGYEMSTPQNITMMGVIAFLSLIIILFFVFGASSQYVPIKLFCLSISVMLIIFTIGYILQLTNISLGEFSSLINGINPIYIVFIALLTVGGAGIVVYLIAMVMTQFSKTRFGIGE